MKLPVVEDISSQFSHLSESVPFGDGFGLVMSKPLPELQTLGTYAVEVHAPQRDNSRFYALICQKEFPPRLDILSTASRVEVPGVVTPVEAGSIVFPEDSVFRFVIVFERPRGKRLLPDPGSRLPQFTDEQVIHGFIHRVVSFFRESALRFLTHRAIRADNVFVDGSGLVTLGEFVSLPPGVLQSALYEPVELAPCSVVGRGDGTHRDDFYSFGVIIAQLAMGGTALDNLPEEEVVLQKLRQGSYAAIIGQNRVSLRLMELLRGLLMDDPEQRWGLPDMEMWLNKRKRSLKASALPTKAARYFSFDGHEYWTARNLAFGFSRNWKEAKGVFKEGLELENWLRRALLNETMANSVCASIKASKTRTGAGEVDDRAVSVSLMAMDPAAAIHFRGLTIHFSAFSQALALAKSNQNEELEKAIVEILQIRLPHHWLGMQKSKNTDALRDLKKLEELEMAIRKDAPSYSISRAVYDTAEGFPCLSSLMGEHFCSDLVVMLDILEVQAKNGRLKGVPVDDDILAFICKNLDGDHSHALAQMAEDDFFVVGCAYLRFLGRVQSSLRDRKFPHLAAYFATLLSGKITTFRNKYFRDEMEKTLKTLSDQGDLDKLGHLLDNPHYKSQDERGFETAKSVYKSIHNKIEWLQNGGRLTSDHARRTAGRAAAIVSGILSVLTVAYVVLDKSI